MNQQISPVAAQSPVSAEHRSSADDFENRSNSQFGVRVIDTKAAAVVDVLPTENVVFPVHGDASTDRRGRTDRRTAHITTASPDGRLGYVSAVASSTVDIIDVQAWKVLA